MLKLAQVGACCTEYDTALPTESLAVGWKLYLLPAVTDVAGVPEIVTVSATDVEPATGHLNRRRFSAAPPTGHC